LVIADGRLAAPAIGAGAAAQNERGRDPVAYRKGPTFRPDFKDFASELVPHDMRQDDIGIGPFPRVMV
jgi:hypothetical protein